MHIHGVGDQMRTHGSTSRRESVGAERCHEVAAAPKGGAGLAKQVPASNPTLSAKSSTKLYIDDRQPHTHLLTRKQEFKRLRLQPAKGRFGIPTETPSQRSF